MKYIDFESIVFDTKAEKTQKHLAYEVEYILDGCSFSDIRLTTVIANNREEVVRYMKRVFGKCVVGKITETHIYAKCPLEVWLKNCILEIEEGTQPG